MYLVVDEKKEEEPKKSLFARFGTSKNKPPATPPNTPVLTTPTTENAQQGKIMSVSIMYLFYVH